MVGVIGLGATCARPKLICAFGPEVEEIEARLRFPWSCRDHFGQGRKEDLQARLGASWPDWPSPLRQAGASSSRLGWGTIRSAHP